MTAARESSRRSAFDFAGPWHDWQRSTRIGRTSRSKNATAAVSGTGASVGPEANEAAETIPSGRNASHARRTRRLIVASEKEVGSTFVGAARKCRVMTPSDRSRAYLLGFRGT